MLILSNIKVVIVVTKHFVAWWTQINIVGSEQLTGWFLVEIVGKFLKEFALSQIFILQVI